MRTSGPVPAPHADRIRELTPLARLARRQHSTSDPKVLASAELTDRFQELYRDGYSVRRIAEAAEMSYHSVRARIKDVA